MRRFFVKNLIFVITINLLVKPVWIFLIDRTVQNRVGHAEYGIYQALFNLSVIFQILLDFGISNYNSRTIAQSPSKLKQVFSPMLSARLLLVLVYALLVMSIGWIIGYREREFMLLVCILMIQVFSSLLQFIRSNVAALHKFRLDGVLSVMDRFLMILVCGFLLLYPAKNSFRIEWYILSQVCCYAAAMLIALFALRSIAKFKLRFVIDRKEIVKIIKDSFPYATLIFLMAIYMWCDAVMIEKLCGDQGKVQAGIYASARRLLEVGNNMFGVMFANMLLPLFGRMLGQKQDVQPIVRLSVNILLPGSLMVAIASLFYNTSIMHMLYPSAMAYDGQVFIWLMWAFPGYCILYIYSTLLTANGSMQLLNRLALGAVLLNVGLNYYLIPRYQALGAAMTSFITLSLLGVGFIVFSTRQIGLPVHIRWIFSHIGFAGLCFVLAWGSTYLPVNWLLQISIFGIVGVVLLFVFRFVSISALKQLTQKE
jgi:O-antigen/teichoic acid export membrane protein